MVKDWNRYTGWLIFKCPLLTYEEHLQYNKNKVMQENSNMCSYNQNRKPKGIHMFKITLKQIIHPTNDIFLYSFSCGKPKGRHVVSEIPRYLAFLLLFIVYIAMNLILFKIILKQMIHPTNDIFCSVSQLIDI